MPNLHLGFSHFLLVSIGAVFGTWARFNFVRYFKFQYDKPYRGTFLLNILASFMLGLFISMEQVLFTESQI